VTVNVDTYGSESAGPEWEDCTWMDVGNVAYDLFAKSLKVCVNGITGGCLIEVTVWACLTVFVFIFQSPATIY
jgi:hypothetical protein